MSKSNDKAKAAANRVTAKLADCIKRAGDIGFTASGSFEDAVSLFTEAAKALPKGANVLKHQGMTDLGEAYVDGYTARRLLTLYRKRWDNYDLHQMIAAASDIRAKPAYVEGKVTRGMRTLEEHRAVRSAQKSLTLVRQRAGIITERKGSGNRTARPSSNEAEPPRELIAASPKLANDNEARDYFKSALASLATTAEINQQTGIKKEVKHVAFLVQSIILDAKAAIEKVLA